MEIAFDTNRPEMIRKHLNHVYYQILAVLPDLMDLGLFFGGGCIRDLWNGDPIKDYDVYFRELPTAAQLDKIMMTLRESRTTILGNIEGKLNVVKLNFILSHHGLPSDTRKDFDFIMNQNTYSPQGENLWIESTDHIENKVLVGVKDSRSAGKLLRAYKFIARGWTIAREEWMALAASEYELMIHPATNHISLTDIFKNPMLEAASS